MDRVLSCTSFTYSEPFFSFHEAFAAPGAFFPISLSQKKKSQWIRFFLLLLLIGQASFQKRGPESSWISNRYVTFFFFHSDYDQWSPENEDGKKNIWVKIKALSFSLISMPYWEMRREEKEKHCGHISWTKQWWQSISLRKRVREGTRRSTWGEYEISAEGETKKSGHLQMQKEMNGNIWNLWGKQVSNVARETLFELQLVFPGQKGHTQVYTRTHARTHTLPCVESSPPLSLIYSPNIQRSFLLVMFAISDASVFQALRRTWKIEAIIWVQSVCIEREREREYTCVRERDLRKEELKLGRRILCSRPSYESSDHCLFHLSFFTAIWFWLMWGGRQSFLARLLVLENHGK